MKKILSVVLAAVMLLTLFAGCGKTEEPANNSPVEVPASALEILEKVWADFAEEEKFFVIGGNMENYVDGAPGEYNLEYAENMTYNLLVPEDRIGDIAGAASMIHAMNANTFTCGVFHLAAGVDAQAFAESMRQAIQGNMWMCGFPDSLLIKVIGGEYVLAAFGVNDAMTPFTTHLDAVYPGAETVASEAIGQ